MKPTKRTSTRRVCLYMITLTAAALCLWGAAAWAAPVAVGGAAASAAPVAVADVFACNKQTVGMGPNVEIRWTSDFKKTVLGTDEVVEVTVQWVIYDKKKGRAANVPTRLTGVGQPTFEEGKGMFVPVPPGHVPSPGDASECGIDTNARSYRTHTVFVTFTELKQPPDRPFASGKAEWPLYVKRGGFDLVLDVTLDVKTPKPGGDED